MPRVHETNAAMRTGACDATDPLARPTVGVEHALMCPIIVAVDGSRESGAALRVTDALAQRDGAPVEAILLEGLAPKGSIGISAENLRRQSPLDSTTRLGRVRRQLCAILETNAWNLHVEFGSFGPAVANLARTTGASLIVLGLRHHRAPRHWLGSGAVARVLQSAQIPVLAVTATARELPHAAVAAIDLSPASLRAARAARDLLARPGTLHLLHVRASASDESGELEGWNAVYGEGVSLELERLANELAADGVTILSRVATGSPTATIVATARDVGAEVIACGASSRSAFDRLVIGSSALELLRDAACSVLIAPATSPSTASKESL